MVRWTNIKIVRTVLGEIVEEAEVVDRFFARHVRVDQSCDVQCMLLWTEWIRYHMREKKKREFPKKIRLTEFNELVHTKFGPALAHDSFRGPLYVGVRFVK